MTPDNPHTCRCGKGRIVSPEGALSISVDWDGRRVHAARVASTRPCGVAQVLTGKRPAEAVAMVPRLFSICGKSQAVAAALACERASGVECDAATQGARTELVDAEIVHEYLWRILLDWPRAVGAAGDAAMLAKVRRRLAEALDASEWAMHYAPHCPERREPRWDAVSAELAGLLAEDVLEQVVLDDCAGFLAWLETGKSWLARTVAQLRTESTDMGAPGVPLLPSMTPALAAGEIARRLDGDERFAAEPEWEGTPRETGARARQQAHPLVAELARAAPSPILPRLAARLVELADLLQRRPGERTGSASIRDGDAIAWVETARGVLIHRVALDGERIARYQIVAPTEWNFHPHGALAVELEGVHVADRAGLERQVDLLVQSLDPCVAYHVEVGHA
jgi:uptake hydrogenase large subunit